MLREGQADEKDDKRKDKGKDRDNNNDDDMISNYHEGREVDVDESHSEYAPIQDMRMGE